MNSKHTDNMPSNDETCQNPVDAGKKDVEKRSTEFFAEHSGGAQAEVLIRKRKKRHSKRKKRLKIAAVALVIVVLLIGGATYALTNFINSGKESITQQTQDATIETPDVAVSQDSGKTVSYEGHDYVFNENIVSVLFVGFDRSSFASEGEEAGQADAMIVAAIDTATGNVTLISIPRDSMALVDVYTNGSFSGQQRMQACLSYSFGDGAESSCMNTARTVSRLLYNIPLTYYFALDESGIGVLNDAIGGVALTPLQSIPQTSIEKDIPTVLFGDNAYRYVQYRDTSTSGSSLDRQARQIQYVQAFLTQTAEQAQGNIGMFTSLFNTASQYSETNLGIEEFSFLASRFLSTGISTPDMTSLPGEMAQGAKYDEYNVDLEATYELILDTYYTKID